MNRSIAELKIRSRVSRAFTVAGSPAAAVATGAVMIRPPKRESKRV
jgi:hypothetical protein